LIVPAPNHPKLGRGENVPWLGFGPTERRTLVRPQNAMVLAVVLFGTATVRDRCRL